MARTDVLMPYPEGKAGDHVLLLAGAGVG